MTVIPIRNLYVMLVFAGRDAGLLSDRDVGECDFDRPLDLLAQLLDASLARLRNRGLERRYITQHEHGAAPRGTVSLDRAIAQLMLPRGHLAWTADDLLSDTPANRVLKAALRIVLRDATVRTERRRGARRSLDSFAGVSDLSPREACRAKAQAPRALPAYTNALRLAHLILEHSLPDEGAEGSSWQRLASDPERMGELFEAFVRGYLAYHLKGRARVHAPLLDWECEAIDVASLAMLPIMRSDVCVEIAGRPPGIIECKFYQMPLVTHVWSEVEKLRSGHLYQLLAYLRAGERRWGTRPRGMLLYAVAGRSVDLTWSLEGFEVRVRSLDLGVEWEKLAKALDEIALFL